MSRKSVICFHDVSLLLGCIGLLSTVQFSMTVGDEIKYPSPGHILSKSSKQKVYWRGPPFEIQTQQLKMRSVLS